MKKHSHHPDGGDHLQAPDRRKFMGGALTAGALFLLPRGGREEAAAAHSRAVEGSRMQKAGGGVAGQMAAAASALSGALGQELQPKILLPFEGEQRADWYFVPRIRKGVTLKVMSPEQRQLAHSLLKTGLGAPGYTKATTIISLENVLREIEQGRGPVRDPELYYFTLFGQPGGNNPWGWSFEGHHISLNYTIVGGREVSNTPLFFGSNPGEVMNGPRKGVSPLRAEEAMGRELFKSLDAAQRAQALVSESAPADILTSNSRKANPLNPAGLAAAKLSGQQSDLLMRLLKEYLSNMPAPLAARRLQNLRAGGFGQIAFAWAGSTERFQPHYYRLQGPGFLVEYDNIQNNANHIHTVWRDFNGDFGEDLLAKHHRQAHRPNDRPRHHHHEQRA